MQVSLSDTSSCIHKQPASFKVNEETGLTSPCWKVIEMWLISQRNSVKGLHDPVLKHSGVNQSYDSWVPQRSSLGLFILFNAYHSLGLLTTLYSPSLAFNPLFVLLLVNFWVACEASEDKCWG